MADGQDMGDLVTSSLNSSVLYFPCNFTCEYSLVLALHSEIGMVPGITLDTNSPRLLCHSKDECPTILGVQICVGQDQEALILLELDVLF